MRPNDKRLILGSLFGGLILAVIIVVVVLLADPRDTVDVVNDARQSCAEHHGVRDLADGDGDRIVVCRDGAIFKVEGT